MTEGKLCFFASSHRFQRAQKGRMDHHAAYSVTAKPAHVISTTGRATFLDVRIGGPWTPATGQ